MGIRLTYSKTLMLWNFVSRLEKMISKLFLAVLCLMLVMVHVSGGKKRNIPSIVGMKSDSSVKHAPGFANKRRMEPLYRKNGMRSAHAVPGFARKKDSKIA